jgi:hypothetical protein
MSEFNWNDHPVVTPILSEEETSKLESFARGAEQGVTFGFGDELNARLESLITGKPYEQARDESRAAFKKSEEDNPLTTLAGNIGGALVVPVPGAAGATTVARLAKIGAGGGALAGLGVSEADLTKGDIGGAAKDIVEGAGTGAAVGGALGIAGKALKGATNIWKDTKLAEEISDTFKFSKTDESFGTKSGLESKAKELKLGTEDYTGKITDIKKSINDQYELAKQTAIQRGETYSFDKFRNDIKSQLDAVPIKDESYVKGRQQIENIVDAIGQVEKKQISVPMTDIEKADEAMNALQGTVGKARVTSDEAIAKLAKKYATNEDGILDTKKEKILFDRFKEIYIKNYNPSFGVDIDPVTGEKFAKAQFTTPAGDLKVKAKPLGDTMRTETVETVGRPDITPELAGSLINKGEDVFSAYKQGGNTPNSSIAEIGLNLKKFGKEQSQDAVQGDIAREMRNQFGDITSKLGLNFEGKSLDDVKTAKEQFNKTLYNTLLGGAKGEETGFATLSFNEANDIVKDMADKGYIKGIDISKTAEKLKDLSKQIILMRKMRTEGTLGTTMQTHLTSPWSATGKALQLASGIGKVSGKMERSAAGKAKGVVADVMRYATLNPEAMEQLAIKLEGQKSPYANVIRGLANQPEQKRKAVIFSLMQQPGFRIAVGADEE